MKEGWMEGWGPGVRLRLSAFALSAQGVEQSVTQLSLVESSVGFI